MNTAKRLQRKLRTIGFDIYVPRRIWLGRGHDNSDWWRWKAGERVSNGGSFVGCNLSMGECVKMSDDELLRRVEYN